jgi:UDP-sulfoquinovose synthase
MGEYGTPNIEIEEGWIDIEHKGRKDRFLFPRQAGSLYHTTKIMDTDLLWFYVRVWGLRVTDLMQGPVYGLETEETGNDDSLYSFLNYDEIFGTVINRFIVQAVHGFPLTVYGQGGQMRGYLNLKDTLNCVKLTIENPAKKGELRVFNQFTETFTVNEIAERIKAAARMLGVDATIRSVPNPRKEAEKHYYKPTHTGLISLGLKPTYLTEEVLCGMMNVVLRYKNRIDSSKFLKNINWN